MGTILLMFEKVGKLLITAGGQKREERKKKKPCPFKIRTGKGRPAGSAVEFGPAAVAPVRGGVIHLSEQEWVCSKYHWGSLFGY